MPDVSRRGFIRNGLVGLGGVYVTSALSGCGGSDDSENLGMGTFAHGVASGDPLANSVILWTRVTPADSSAEAVRVSWEIADNQAFNNIIAEGSGEAHIARDFTIKVDVQGLSPDSHYYYRFKTASTTSTVGRTRTMPDNSAEQLSLAVVSCSNYPAGFFHVYNEIANKSVDLVLHLGDYIYEYGRDGYASDMAAQMNREVLPASEILSLDDYRARYAQYRTDKNLQKAHASAPFLVVWDDHEIANDTYIDGAENHDASEGDFVERKLAALRAYFEWLPIRSEGALDSDGLAMPSSIYRQFEWGNLVNLLMLDTRNEARAKPLETGSYFNAQTGTFDFTGLFADINDPARELLGAPQRDWLAAALTTSSATWQMLGQQVLMGRMNLPFAIATQQMSIPDYAELGALALLAARAEQGDPSLSTDELAYLQANQERLTPEVVALLQAPSIPYNLDAWDGYGYAREQVLAMARQANARLVVLAGDTHNAWASEIADADGNFAAVELATSSVSSPGLEEYLAIPADAYAQTEAGIVNLVEGLKYLNSADRGLLTLDITHERIIARWEFVTSVQDSDYSLQASRTQEMTVSADNPYHFS
ncbi:alkaline phosphatase D family protein [Gilvimarinus sp. 1_MG-2023]|uniref:alkaline phosphatase D family protein n=1 Tax=Gilvimarinus sp. 1_MG-2023 TaxID=3062638 RepID=UPI0026E28E22|nr:alkaline phosphatase D family protein [Gilvimarinus sp. 1_MG-2023]MDO6746658.1 alkaline phosphatase D family protein [Gilvimarinus sp. 1_MG-2023]